MYKYFLLLIIIEVVLGSLDLPQIIGGDPTDIEDYPHQISMMENGKHECGGSILNQQFILTAAHCIYTSSAENLQIRAGSSFINDGGTVIQVAKIHFHAQFDPETFDYDVALLELEVPLEYGPAISSIKLIDAGDEIVDGVTAVATGWGRTTNSGPFSVELRKVEIPTISTKKCIEYYGEGPEGITDRMFCAGVEGKDTCQGDSGGPIIADNILIGLTSWGGVCGKKNNPGVYTKISNLREYIDEIIN